MPVRAIVAQTAAEVCGVSSILFAASWFHLSLTFTLPTTMPINSSRGDTETTKSQAKSDSQYHLFETKMCANFVGCSLLIYPLIIGRVPRAIPFQLRAHHLSLS